MSLGECAGEAEAEEGHEKLREVGRRRGLRPVREEELSLRAGSSASVMGSGDCSVGWRVRRTGVMTLERVSEPLSFSSAVKSSVQTGSGSMGEL